MTGFEKLKEDYESCPNFRVIYAFLMSDLSRSMTGFIFQDGYLFKGTCLCIPCTSMRDFLTWELHAGSITDHFG